MKLAICFNHQNALQSRRNCTNQVGSTLLEFVVATAILVACFVLVALVMDTFVAKRAERSFDASDSVVPCRDQAQQGDRGLRSNDCF